MPDNIVNFDILLRLKCDLCDHSTSQAFALKCHMRAIHGKGTPTPSRRDRRQADFEADFPEPTETLTDDEGI